MTPTTAPAPWRRAALWIVVATLAVAAGGVSLARGATVEQDAHSGTWYGTTSTSSPGGGAYEDVGFASSAGQLVCASAWLRTQYPSTGASGTLAVWLIGGSGSEDGTASYSGLGTLGNWTQLHTCVEATAPHSEIRIQFYPAPGSPTVAMDDVDVHASLALNGGFENGSGPWTVYPGTASNYVDYAAGAANPAHSGSHFAATNTATAGGGIYEDVPLNTSAGELVCGSAWLRNEGSETGATGSFALWLLGSSANESGSTPWGGLGHGADWRQVQTCVEATGAHTTLRIQFYPTPGSATTEIDDVDVHTSLALNGGFENGSGPWTVYPGTASNYVDYAAGTANPAHSGSHFGATNTATAGGGIYEDVPLSTSAGELVCGSAWLRTEGSGTGAAGAFALWLLGGGPSDGATAGYSGLGNGPNWSEVQTCVEATSAHSTLRIQLYPTPGSPTVEVDDVDVHPSLAANGGFEYGSSPWGIFPGTESTYDVVHDGQVPVPSSPASPAHPAPPVTTVVPISHGRRALRIRLALRWTWYYGRPVTRLDQAWIGHFPGATRLTVSCSGRHCPLRGRHTAAGSRRIHRLLRGLIGRRWSARDRLRIRFTARGWAAEQAVVVFRFGHRPIIRP